MAENPQSEFERIFGKTQRSSDANSPGSTQKVPSDSDVLGIRTDSDRFLVKNVPEQLPIDQANVAQAAKPDPQGPKSSQDAMTIALNVNVFANLGDTKKSAKKPGEITGADGPTFVIPLSKESAKAGGEIYKFSSQAGSTASPSVEGKISPGLHPDTEFTRILQIQDSIKVPRPKSLSETEEPPATAVPDAKPTPALPQTILPGVTASGPSDFTKVVKGSEIRALQEKLAATAANAPGNTGGAAQPWQPAPPPAVPQYIPAPNAAWSGSAPPSASPARSVPAPHQSKLSQYMPLIIGLNVLVLLAILLIVFFALKK
jgi:hypothetical protein